MRRARREAQRQRRQQAAARALAATTRRLRPRTPADAVLTALGASVRSVEREGERGRKDEGWGTRGGGRASWPLRNGARKEGQGAQLEAAENKREGSRCGVPRVRRSR
jgi:hypothetical protein